MTHRWANTKSKCKSISRGENVKHGTGLEKHVKNGCSQFKWPELSHVKVSLLEQFNTTEEKLQAASHVAGADCQCSQCLLLKKMEDKWIFRMGTYHGDFGLNERDEILNRTRASYWRGHGGNISTHHPVGRKLLTSQPRLGEEASPLFCLDLLLISWKCFSLLISALSTEMW